MDRAYLQDLHLHGAGRTLPGEVPLPGLRVLGTLSVSERGALYAVRWTPRSTREPALLALRIVEDPGKALYRRLERLAARIQEEPIPGLAVPIDYGITTSGRTYYTTELFERDLSRIPGALEPALPALLTDVARVLAAMHQRGLVHGNLHAGNVLIKEHATSYSIALCDPAVVACDGAEAEVAVSAQAGAAADVRAWAQLVAQFYGQRVSDEGALEPAAEGSGANASGDAAPAPAMPPALASITARVLARSAFPLPGVPALLRVAGVGELDRGGLGSGALASAAELVAALDAHGDSDAVVAPRMRLAVGSGPTRSESAHARRALTRAGFEVLSCLGHGAYATVFRVHRGGRERAAKVLHGRYAMERLAGVQRALEHLRGVGDAPLAMPDELGTLPTGAPFYVTDVFAGTLQTRAQSLNRDELLAVLGELASGLARLHRQGLVHRDLKPSNVLLSRGDELMRVALADFERTAEIGAEDGYAGAGGMPSPHPPEAGQRDAIAPAWDVWSWAATALWALTVQALAGDEDGYPGVVGGVQSDDGVSGGWMGGLHFDEGTIEALALTAAQPAGTALAELPSALVSLLRACLERDPDKRPSAARVCAQLARLAETAGHEDGDGSGLAGEAAEVAAVPLGLAAKAVGSARLSLPVAAADAGNPFLGLRPLRADEGEQLFGRASDIERLSGLLDTHSLVVLSGARGAGKSSLLAAGVVPALRRRGDVLPIAMVPGRRPFTALARALLAGLGTPAEGGRDAASPPDTAEVSSLAERLRRYGLPALCPVIDLLSENGRPVLLIDECEELFTAVEASERRAFAALLGAALTRSAEAGRGLGLLFAVCDSFCDALLALPPFATGVAALMPPASGGGAGAAGSGAFPPAAHARHRLLRWDGESIAAWLTQVQARAGRSGADALDDDLVQAVAAYAAVHPYGLCVAQLLGHALWRMPAEQRAASGRRPLDALGGAEAVIAGYFDALLAGVYGDGDGDEALWRDIALPVAARRAAFDEVVRAILLGFVDESASGARPITVGEIAQRFARESPLRSLAERVLPALVAHGLLRWRDAEEGARDASTRTVALVHDAVLVVWPALRTWIVEEPRRVRALASIRAQAEAWAASGRADASLWTGVALVRMQANPMLRNAHLEGLDAEFWQACMQREQAQRERALSVCVLLAVVLFLGVVLLGLL